LAILAKTSAQARAAAADKDKTETLVLDEARKRSTVRIGSRPGKPPKAITGAPVAMMIGAACRALTEAAR
jgi:hypothetical protein